MSSQPPISERRRGERVMIRIPVKVYGLGKDGQHVNEAAETAVISRHGALLRLSTPLKHATNLEILNTFTQKTEKFRVVWVAEKPKDGKFDIGVEFLHPQEEFWGVRFPERVRRA
jgi:hypothetical protein